VSHDAHGAPGAAEGPPLPTTAGIAMGVKVLVVGGMLLAILQGSFVAASSGFGRIWPAADSDKIGLPPSTLK
jgi:hypothetical protein